MFCEGICPTGAIPTIDDYLAAQKKQPKTTEAQTPEGATGAYNTILYLCEATGRFRRLIKEEDVGFNTPWETVTGHPRHKELP